MSASNEKKKGKKSVFKIPKFLKNIRKKASNPSEIPNPPETVDSLLKYETKPGQAQKFLDRVGPDFRWPVSMIEPDRATAVFYIADDSACEYDDETGFNLICFFDNFDNGTFDEHKDSWVLIYKQEVKKYGSELSSKEMEDLENEMPGAIYLPIDEERREDLVKVAPARTVHAQRTGNEHMVRIQVRKLGTTNSVIFDYNFRDPVEGNKLYRSIIDSGAPETILPYHVRSALGKQGWSVTSRGYGEPSRVFTALISFELAIGDNNTWSKWVRTNTLRIWQRDPGSWVRYIRSIFLCTPAES
ncbi:hypothetical protein Glove_315g80 [Diversispora epigaea]|uniref:Peptidase A2 domain-containing protein n=1 Tax=Diversispora epigaea TaxID=1348612 RepID=A0A397HY29_9GLOM|nr:hypothetical protein Glove_315g80 [Diversispora epigaea]